MVTQDLGAGSSFAVDNLTVRTAATIPGVSIAAARVTAATPADPATTVSTTAVMAGLGFTFTPQSAAALVTITGAAGTQTGATICTVSARYGTGTAPANGATASSSGTAFPQAGIGARAAAAATTPATPFAIQSKLTGLTSGTTYWVDVAFKTASGSNAAVLGSICVTALDCQ